MATKPQPLTTQHHLVYICSRFLAYGLPLVYFLVAISFYLKTYDSAQVKITFTQMGTTILFFVWVTKMLLEGRFPFEKKDLVFVLPFILHLVWGLVSYAHSPFKMWALEETSRRVFYMVLALITISEFRSAERIKRLWRWLLAAAWVSIGYGMVQYLDSRFYVKNVDPGFLDPFIWRQAFGHRVFSTFGNPNFYGNFLVIVTPLILASIFRNKGPLLRPFLMIGLTLGFIFFVDKMTLGSFGGYDASYQIVFSAAIVLLLFGFWWASVNKVGSVGSTTWLLILFALLFLNLFSTETKGAWLGFAASVAATFGLILEYFLRMDERIIEDKKYVMIVGILGGLFILMEALMIAAFVLPLLKGSVTQTGFSILWIPTLFAGLAAVLMMLWVVKRPWNLRKVIYGFLVFFVLSMGGGVMEYASARLTSISFRIFTWISTWEMIQTDPILGNGIGTFKVIYPAFRRPEIIVLEGKSNTETDHAEDEYIEVWQDEGMIGFGIFLWMLIFAMACGFKQLRWFSNARVRDGPKKRKLLDIDNDPRSFEVMGLLAAYIGASIHWMVDVSIRFVSSGIFSGLLPGLLVAYARNHNSPIVNEVRLGYDRWIRAAVAGVWTLIFLFLGLELVPQRFIGSAGTSSGQITFFILLAGLGIFILLELLEMGNTPAKDIPFNDQYPDPIPTGRWIRVAAVFLVAIFCFKGMRFYAHHFQADVHHNLAIFFSKSSIWKKAGVFNARATRLPADIRKKYKKYGGALDHYEQVRKKNPSFPMAWYFTGNVYNDWGSQDSNKSNQARSKGDLKEAQLMRDLSLEKWNKAEEAYNGTKNLAPNYVQTHHQVGLLYLKRAQQAQSWGELEKAQAYYDQALENFYKYKMIDPVFIANYDRIVSIILPRGKFKEAQELYKEALYYHTDVSRRIRNFIVPHHVSKIALALAKIFYTDAKQTAKDPFNPRLPQIDETIKYFKVALEVEPNNMEALKGYGFILNEAGERQKAQEFWRKALKINPNDPELRANVRKK